MRVFSILMLSVLTLLAKTLPLPVLYDPFVKAKKIIEKSRTKNFSPPRPMRLELTAILNDKAYINGRFYKIGDTISGYKIVKIADSYVVLKKKDKMKILFLGKRRFLRVGER